MNDRIILMTGRAGVPVRFWNYIDCPVELVDEYTKEGWVRCSFEVNNPKILKRKNDKRDM